MCDNRPMNSPAVDPETPFIEISDARVVRDGNTILHIESLRLYEGEHVAVLGPNGAGKSTLVGLVTRDVRPVPRADDRPAVLLFGRERWDLFEARSMLGVVSDSLQETHRRAVTVRDVVRSGYFGSIGLYRRREVTERMEARVSEVLSFLEVARLAERTLDTLSTGEARRALIGRALVHDPRVLVLDEPLHGLDPRASHDFRGLMRRLADSGRTLVLVTHHVDDIIPEIERVVAVKDGSITHDGSKHEVLTSENLSALYGFEAHLECRDGAYRLW